MRGARKERRALLGHCSPSPLWPELPEVTGSSGHITGFSLKLGRSFSYRGHRRSYLSASCPAPKRLPGAVFPFARANFGFAKQKVEIKLTRSCRARG